MILRIILLILIILALALIIAFSFYIFLPSIAKNNSLKNEDPVISFSELNYHFPMNKPLYVSDKKAVIKSIETEESLVRPFVNENHTCFMEKSLRSSGVDRKGLCLALGDCAKVCLQKAIYLENNKAFVINELCCGCGRCVNVCPQKIISMIPKTSLSEILKEDNNKNVTHITKKGFKIWSLCYKIIRKINLLLLKIEGN